MDLHQLKKTTFIALGLSVAGASVAEVPEKASTMGDRCNEFITERHIPPYPAAARHLKLNGKTEIQYSLDGSGSVFKMEISKSSGSQILDKSTIQSLQNTKFKPGVRQSNCLYTVEYQNED